jgi:hypothetical protein
MTIGDRKSPPGQVILHWLGRAGRLGCAYSAPFLGG